MKKSIVFLCFICVIGTKSFAGDKQLLVCGGYDWQDVKNLPEGKFECGFEYDNGFIELLPKYKRIVKSLLDRPRQATILNNSRSKYLLATFALTKSHGSGSAYIKSDGTGYRVVFFDNGPDYFKNGVARYLASGKMGFINKRGQIVILAQFDFVSPFQDGYAHFCSGCRQVKDGEHSKIVDGQWYSIDMQGNTVIAPKLSPIPIKKISQLNKQALSCSQFCNSHGVRQAYQKQCSAGNLAACTGYGKLLSELLVSEWALGNRDLEFYGLNYSTYLDFKGLDLNNLAVKTHAFLQRHCVEHSNQQLCAVLSIHKFNNGDVVLAQKLLAHACETAISWACTNLGYLEDLSFSHEIAFQYYKKACSLRDRQGCYNAGTSEYREKNIASARKYFLMACGYGLSAACETVI